MARGTEGANAGQAEFWNSGAGRKWVEHQAAMDAAFLPVGERMLKMARLKLGERALDIGCGSGAVSLAAAERVGAAGRVLGVDISAPLIEAAEGRSAETANVEFLLGDAQTQALPPGAFDVLVSRFGMMFFADPVAAFRNMSASLRRGGRMVFASWAKLRSNPWFSISADAATARFGRPPPADAHAPGPLAFADIDRVVRIMRDAGLKDCAGVEKRIPVELAEPEKIARLAVNFGPASRLVEHFGGGVDDLRAIEADIRTRLGEYVVGGVVRLPLTINFYSAVKT